MTDSVPDPIYPRRRRWPWYLFLALVLVVGALAGWIAFLHAQHLARFRVDGIRGCEARIVFATMHGPQRRRVSLPWETSVDVRGSDTLILFTEPLTPVCATAPVHCTIEVDGHGRSAGGDACAEWAGRFWGIVSAWQ